MTTITAYRSASSCQDQYSLATRVPLQAGQSCNGPSTGRLGTERLLSRLSWSGEKMHWISTPIKQSPPMDGFFQTTQLQLYRKFTQVISSMGQRSSHWLLIVRRNGCQLTLWTSTTSSLSLMKRNVHGSYVKVSAVA